MNTENQETHESEPNSDKSRTQQEIDQLRLEVHMERLKKMLELERNLFRGDL